MECGKEPVVEIIEAVPDTVFLRPIEQGGEVLVALDNVLAEGKSAEEPAALRAVTEPGQPKSRIDRGQGTVRRSARRNRYGLVLNTGVVVLVRPGLAQSVATLRQAVMRSMCPSRFAGCRAPAKVWLLAWGTARCNIACRWARFLRSPGQYPYSFGTPLSHNTPDCTARRYPATATRHCWESGSRPRPGQSL